MHVSSHTRRVLIIDCLPKGSVIGYFTVSPGDSAWNDEHPLDSGGREFWAGLAWFFRHLSRDDSWKSSYPVSRYHRSTIQNIFDIFCFASARLRDNPGPFPHLRCPFGVSATTLASESGLSSSELFASIIQSALTLVNICESSLRIYVAKGAPGRVPEWARTTTCPATHGPTLRHRLIRKLARSSF